MTKIKKIFNIIFGDNMNKQEELEKLYKECIEELKSINIDPRKNRTIETKINTRSKKRYGCCKKLSKDRFQIEISEWVIDLNEDIIKNTIMHELIHCMPRCNNHGEYFKNYATVINEKLGYNISRTGNKEQDFKESNLEYIEKPINFNYKIVCEDCNYSFFRQRVRRYFIRKYRCGKCGGRFKVFKIRNIIFANH